MKRKRLLPIILLLPMFLTACQAGAEDSSQGYSSEEPDSSSSSSSSSVETSSSSSSSASSSTEVYDLNDALSALTADNLVFSGDLNFKFYTAGTTEIIQETNNDQITAYGFDYYYAYYDELITPADGSDPYHYTEETTYFDDYGNICAKTLMPDNKVYIQYYTDADGNMIPFANYTNPLKDLSLSNLSLEGNSAVAVSGLSEELGTTIAKALTWYSDVPFTSLTFDLEDNKLTGGTFVGEAKNITYTSGDTTLNLDVSITYEFDLVDISETNFSYVTPFEAKEGDEELDALFAKLALGNYTMDISRTSTATGAQNFSYTCYYQDDLVIRYTDDAAEGTAGIGWYNPDETETGIVQVDYEVDESGAVTLSGTGVSAADAKISDYVSAFSFAAAVFDHNADGSYTLKKGYGFDNYIQYTAPDFAWNMTDFLYNYVDGSLNIVIGENNTATFTYDYAYTYYGALIEGTITLDLYNIGATDLKFTYAPYVAPDYSSWEGYGEEVVAVIKSFFGDDALNFFPAVDPNTAYSITNFERRYDPTSDNPYGFFLANYNSATDINNVLTTYIATLKATGWVATDEENGYYKYELSDGSGYYSLRVWAMNSRWLYINIFELTPSASNDLDAFFIDNFWQGTNCTITQAERRQYYKLNTSTSEYEYVQTSDNGSTTITYDYTKASVKTSSSSITSYFNSDRIDHSAVSYYQSNLDDGGATMILQSTYDYATIEDYALETGALIHPLTLRDYTSYFTQSSTDPTRFDVTSSEAAFAIYAALTGMSESQQESAIQQGYTYSGYAVLGSESVGDATSPTLEVVFTQTRNTTTSTGSWQYRDEVVLTIDSIGSSSVTLPAIYTAEA